MVGASADSDPVIVREHVYFDSGLSSLVLTESGGNFVAVEEQGLGIFSYLWDSGKSSTLYESEISYENELAMLLSVIGLFVLCVVCIIKIGTITRQINRAIQYLIKGMFETPIEMPTNTFGTKYKRYKTPTSRKRSKTCNKRVSYSPPTYHQDLEMQMTSQKKLAQSFPLKTNYHQTHATPELIFNFNPKLNTSAAKLSYSNVQAHTYKSSNPFELAANYSFSDSSVSSTDSVFSPRKILVDEDHSETHAGMESPIPFGRSKRFTMD